MTFSRPNLRRPRLARLDRINYARLNHILIPETKAGRDRWRRSRGARLLGPLARLWNMFSEEGHFVLVFWIIAGVVSTNTVTQGYQYWSMVTGLLAASVLIRRRFALKDVGIEVRAPRRSTVGDEVTFLVELDNRGDSEHRAIRIKGPFLPWDGSYVGDSPVVQTLRPGQTAQAACTIRFSARGEHHLDPFGANALVPFALTTGPGVESGGVRFLIVPRIAPVKALHTPLAERYQPGGVALASRTGESRELLGVRPYRPGDPIRDLHARSWARVGEPVVREYRQEYFTRIGVVVDTDASRVGEERFEAALSLAAGIVAHLTRGQALIDLLVVGEQVLRTTLGRSLGFLDQALDLLACVKPGKQFNRTDLEARLNPHMSRLSYIVLLTFDWSEQRRQIVEWIEKQGVGCRVLRVAPEGEGGPEAGAAVSGARVTTLTARDITGGKELVL